RDTDLGQERPGFFLDPLDVRFRPDVGHLLIKQGHFEVVALDRLPKFCHPVVQIREKAVVIGLKAPELLFTRRYLLKPLDPIAKPGKVLLDCLVDGLPLLDDLPLGLDPRQRVTRVFQHAVRHAQAAIKRVVLQMDRFSFKRVLLEIFRRDRLFDDLFRLVAKALDPQLNSPGILGVERLVGRTASFIHKQSPTSRYSWLSSSSGQCHFLKESLAESPAFCPRANAVAMSFRAPATMSPAANKPGTGSPWLSNTCPSSLTTRSPSSSVCTSQPLRNWVLGSSRSSTRKPSK